MEYVDRRCEQRLQDDLSADNPCEPRGVLTSRVGFELELLAPPGSSRRELALALAERFGGMARPTFHADAEPSKVPGMDLFHHLTPAFEVLDSYGELRCTLVDDVTLVTDLDAHAPAEPGWYRIVSDDARILRLVARHCDPGAPLDRCLQPIADLFGVHIEHKDEFVRVNDDHGATIAIGAPLPGERHRTCEIVTPPFQTQHAARLEELLGPARKLGFTIPTEAAAHVHFDAPPLRDPTGLRNLVRLVFPRHAQLRWMVQTNPRCHGLGSLPASLVEVVEDQAFLDASWDQAQRLLGRLNLSKYADLNLRNLVQPPPGKDTIEWRILPGALHAEPVIEGARLFEAILRRAQTGAAPDRLNAPVPPGPEGVRAFLAEIGLADSWA
ncbi:MAG: amidoligase family protein [Egibacteraceae bacterium]